MCEANDDLAIILECPHQLGDGFGAYDEFALLTRRDLKVVNFGQGKAASIGGDESELVAFEREKDAIENVAGLVEGDGVVGFAQTVFEIGGLELEFDGAIEGGETGELRLGHTEDFVNTGAALECRHALGVDLDLEFGFGKVFDQRAETPGRERGRTGFAHLGFDLGADGEIEIGRGEDEFTVGGL